MIKKITKKEVNEMFGNCFQQNDSGGVYVYNGKINGHVKGFMTDVVYNEEYAAYYDLSKILRENDCYKKVWINSLQEEINGFVERFNKNQNA